jgi:hypothetical protein
MVKKFEVKDKWWSNWMQVEGDQEGATFKREKLLAARSRDLILGSVPSGVTDIILGLDPAIRQYCACVVWGVDRKTGTRYLVDLVNQRGMGNWDNVSAMTVELAARYKAYVVVVETNNTQGDVYMRVDRACRQQGIRCVGYQTVTSTGARAEETDFSISSIGYLFDSDMIVLPYGDEETTKKVDAYIDQLCNWHPKPAGSTSWHLVRDMVMATLFAESEARKILNRPKKKSRPRPLPDFVRQRFAPRRERTHGTKTLSDEEVAERRALAAT